MSRKIIDELPESLIDLLIRDYEAAKATGLSYKRTLCYDYKDLLGLKLKDCYQLLKEIEEREIYYRSSIILQESSDTPDFTDGELRVYISTKNILIDQEDMFDMLELAKQIAIQNAAHYGFNLSGWIEKLHQVGLEHNERIDKDEVEDRINTWYAKLVIKDQPYDIFERPL